MKFENIKNNMVNYNSWVEKYENDRAEVQKNFTPEAFYKWNKEAVRQLKEKTDLFAEELKKYREQELTPLKEASYRRPGYLNESVVELLSTFDDMTPDELSHIARSVDDETTRQYIAKYAADRNIIYEKPVTAKTKYEAASKFFNTAEWVLNNALADRNARAQLKQFSTDDGFNAFSSEAAKIINEE